MFILFGSSPVSSQSSLSPSLAIKQVTLKRKTVSQSRPPFLPSVFILKNAVTKMLWVLSARVLLSSFSVFPVSTSSITSSHRLFELLLSRGLVGDSAINTTHFSSLIPSLVPTAPLKVLTSTDHRDRADTRRYPSAVAKVRARDFPPFPQPPCLVHLSTASLRSCHWKTRPLSPSSSWTTRSRSLCFPPVSFLCL